MSGFEGSSSTWRTPRGEHGVPLTDSAASPVHGAIVGAPLWTNVQLAPPSVDL